MAINIKVTVYWDIENCPVPEGYEGYEVVVAIRNLALRYGFLHRIVAIGNLEQLAKPQRNALQDSGVSMHDVCSRKPSAADMAIFVEILKLALDIPPPHVIVMITGDRDFSKVLHVLVGRGYRVVLLHSTPVCPVLKSTASEHYSWIEFVKRGCSPTTTTSTSTSLKQTPSPTGSTTDLVENSPTPKLPIPTPSRRTTTQSATPISIPSLAMRNSNSSFAPLVNYLTVEAKQGRHVIKMCDLGVQKEIPWRRHYQKLKSYIEGAVRSGLVTMIYLPNNQIGICLTDKCQFPVIRKIQKLVQDLPYLLEQMKMQFLAPVEQNLQNVVKSRYGLRPSSHHWEIFLQCLQCCGYQTLGTAGKRTIIGPLGNFDGFDPSDPRHTLQRDVLAEFDAFLETSQIDAEGSFAWNSNSGRFGFVTDLLQVGPPLIRSTPSGILLSHIQILLNKHILGYNKDNKICQAACADQSANIKVDIDSFRMQLENTLLPHSTPLHPLIELQIIAPIVREIWKSLGFSKMKHYLKLGEELGILLCEWTAVNNLQPWIALASSLKPFLDVIQAHFNHSNSEVVNADVIKSKLEKKYGHFNAKQWRELLTVASKHPSVVVQNYGMGFMICKKKENDSSKLGVVNPGNPQKQQVSVPALNLNGQFSSKMDEPVLTEVATGPPVEDSKKLVDPFMLTKLFNKKTDTCISLPKPLDSNSELSLDTCTKQVQAIELIQQTLQIFGGRMSLINLRNELRSKSEYRAIVNENQLIHIINTHPHYFQFCSFDPKGLNRTGYEGVELVPLIPHSPDDNPPHALLSPHFAIPPQSEPEDQEINAIKGDPGEDNLTNEGRGVFRPMAAVGTSIVRTVGEPVRGSSRFSEMTLELEKLEQEFGVNKEGMVGEDEEEVPNQEDFLL